MAIDPTGLPPPITDTQRLAWRTKAVAQGLLCIICGDVPELESRADFYDTGLCAACASGLETGPAAKLTPTRGAF